MNKNWLIGGLAGVLLVLAGLAFVQGGGEEGAAAAEEHEGGIVQPIQFPHNLHAGSGPEQANMNCQFCHFSAERSVDAGIPPVATCYGCHQVIQGRNNPQETQKVVDYYERGEQIPWVRIYKIADHAHFPHMRHINAGLECQQCHGEVQEMGVLTERSPVWGGSNMGWCIDCHRNPPEGLQKADGTPIEHASTDCARCHY